MFSPQHIDILVNLVLALITFSLGLTLTRNDFKNLLIHPGSLSIGLLSQIVLLPLLAWYIMGYFHFDPILKVGFLIISFCPGGVTSNLVTFMLRGNVALSISLTVLNSVITIFTIPVFTNFALDYYVSHGEMIKLPFFETTLSIFLVTLLPAIIGVTLRAKYKTLTKKIQPALRYILPILLFFVFAVKLFAGKESGGTGLTLEETLQLAVPSLVLNISGMFLGFLLSSIFFLKLKNRITILIEVGLQNTALALLISGVLLDNHDMEKPAMVYAMLTFVSTFLFAYIVKNIFYRWKMKQNTKADLIQNNN